MLQVSVPFPPTAILCFTGLQNGANHSKKEKQVRNSSKKGSLKEVTQQTNCLLLTFVVGLFYRHRSIYEGIKALRKCTKSDIVSLFFASFDIYKYRYRYLDIIYKTHTHAEYT